MANNKFFFRIFKRMFDICFSIILLPFFFTIILFLFFLNPLFNKGSVFFIQKRMGKDCIGFNTIKFRTLEDITSDNNCCEESVKEKRIYKLGMFLRKTHIDELPQILNVLKGDMSLIGPRPEYFLHAQYYIENIKDYKFRHNIKPGISGLSQIRLGYARGIKETEKKTVIGAYYIKNAGFILDTKIFFGTILEILRRSGV